jgi:hypothetical protein
MARFNSPEALTKRGYSLQAVKEWRTREYEAGRPSGLDDFFRAHGLCVECGGSGRLVVGVQWHDANGIERMERGPVAALVQRHNLQKPHETAQRDKLDWDYLYETCTVCKGTGEQTPKNPNVNC